MVFKALVCLALFCATDLLKTLAAKSLARTFHKEAHFVKMQDALEKVWALGTACVCMHMHPLAAEVLASRRPSTTMQCTMAHTLMDPENTSDNVPCSRVSLMSILALCQ